MIDPLTLSVSELAERWKWTPRQVLDYASSLGVPLYFLFDGLAFDLAEKWLRHGGDWSKRRELDALEHSIASNEDWLRRNARGETGPYDSISTDEVKELRAAIEADKLRRNAINVELNERELERRKHAYRGLMRAAPLTLFELAQNGTASAPRKALYPGAPVKVTQLPYQGEDGGATVLDGRWMSLEPHSGSSYPQLSVENLCASTAEVKAIEARLSAKAKPTPAEIDQPAAEDVSARNARWLADFDREERVAKRGAQARAIAAVVSREGVKADTVKKGIQSAKKLRDAGSRDGAVRRFRDGKVDPASPWEALKSRPR